MRTSVLPYRQLILLGISALLTLSFLLGAAGPLRAQEVRTQGGVVEFAKILTEREKVLLKEVAGQLARKIDTDFFIVTIDDRSTNWSRLKSHTAMVDKVFSDIRQAIIKDLRRDANLTLLIVFKSSAVLHLRTNLANLEQHLFWENFYSGVAGAWVRVRAPGEDYLSATLRYLRAFEQTFTQQSLGGDAMQLARHPLGQWLDFTAIVSTRLIVGGDFAHAILEPFRKFFFTVIGFVTHVFEWPGWFMLILFVGALHVISIFVEYYVSTFSAWWMEIAYAWAQAFVLALPFGFLFSLAHGDLENILYASQVYSGSIREYLTWSEEFPTLERQMTYGIIASAMLSVALLEIAIFIQKVRFDSGILRSIGNWLGLVFHVLAAVIWVFSTWVWPTAFGMYFISIAILARLAAIFAESRRQSRYMETQQRTLRSNSIGRTT